MRKEIKLGLGRILQLLLLLGGPHKELKYIHVAGTNGKGSTCTILSHILVAADYKTGLFTSPYISSPTEMISIDNTPISQEQLDTLLAQITPHFAVMQDEPTEFEVLTAAAFLHFYQQKCDIVVLEVGMGGRLDATNVIPPPLVSIITALGMDHSEYLGNTIEQIAAEKAGIVKRGTKFCVVHPQSPAAEAVIRDKCEEQGVMPYFINSNTIKSVSQLPVALPGAHQINNAAMAILSIGTLDGEGFEVCEEDVFEGLMTAKMPGRFETLQLDPDFIIDVAHNLQSIEATAATLQSYYPNKKINFIFGVLADKDYKQMTEVLLPLAKRFFAVTPDNERALPAAELAEYIAMRGGDVVVCDSIEEGAKMALEMTNENDVICALGSIYILGRLSAAISY